MTTQRTGQAIRIAIAGFLSLALPLVAACHKFDHVEQHGVFTLKLHMRDSLLRWEGGTTWLASSSLCSSVDGQCIEAWDIQVQPSKYSPEHPRIMISTLPDRDAKQPRTTSFRDASTGATLRCSNCTAGMESQISRSGAGWGSTQDIGVADLSLGNGLSRRLLLEFSGTNYRITDLGTWPEAQLGHGITFAPDDAGLAWYICDPHCTMHVFFRGDRSSMTIPVPPQCPDNGYLDVGWAHSRPFPQFYWGAMKQKMCFLPDGRPALPRGAPPEGTSPLPAPDGLITAPSGN